MEFDDGIHVFLGPKTKKFIFNDTTVGAVPFLFSAVTILLHF